MQNFLLKGSGPHSGYSLPGEGFWPVGRQGARGAVWDAAEGPCRGPPVFPFLLISPSELSVISRGGWKMGQLGAVQWW